LPHALQSFPATKPGKKSNKSQPPTEAHPDFLPRSTGHAASAAFRKESRMKFANATNLDRKSAGA
jgi:hypothetical protein